MACSCKLIQAKYPDGIDRLDCGTFPDLPIYERPKVKVLNKKYCWLYPQREAKIFLKKLPNSDDIKTIYTRCDYKIEQAVHAQLIRVEKFVRQHNEVVNSEIAFQKKIIKDMWVQSQRYVLLTQSGCHKLAPDLVSDDAEIRALCKFKKNFKALKVSNGRMASSLRVVRETIAEVNKCCRALDMTVESTFLVGDAFTKPLAYTRKIMDDLYDYFNTQLTTLKSWAQVIDIKDLWSVDDYQALLDLDYVGIKQIGQGDCTCLRSRIRNCIDKFEDPCRN